MDAVQAMGWVWILGTLTDQCMGLETKCISGAPGRFKNSVDKAVENRVTVTLVGDRWK